MLSHDQKPVVMWLGVRLIKRMWGKCV